MTDGFPGDIAFEDRERPRPLGSPTSSPRAFKELAPLQGRASRCPSRRWTCSRSTLDPDNHNSTVKDGLDGLVVKKPSSSASTKGIINAIPRSPQHGPQRRHPARSSEDLRSSSGRPRLRRRGRAMSPGETNGAERLMESTQRSPSNEVTMKSGRVRRHFRQVVRRRTGIPHPLHRRRRPTRRAWPSIRPKALEHAGIDAGEST